MRLHHIGFVVKNIEEAYQNFHKDFGLIAQTEVIVDKLQKVRLMFLSSGEVGETKIELLEPIGQDSPVSQFLHNGGGLHHLAFEVENINGSLAEISDDKKIKIICPAVKGAGHNNRLISFLFVRKDAPKGYIVEYVEK